MGWSGAAPAQRHGASRRCGARQGLLMRRRKTCMSASSSSRAAIFSLHRWICLPCVMVAAALTARAHRGDGASRGVSRRKHAAPEYARVRTHGHSRRTHLRIRASGFLPACEFAGSWSWSAECFTGSTRLAAIEMRGMASAGSPRSCQARRPGRRGPTLYAPVGATRFVLSVSVPAQKETERERVEEERPTDTNTLARTHAQARTHAPCTQARAQARPTPACAQARGHGSGQVPCVVCSTVSDAPDVCFGQGSISGCLHTYYRRVHVHHDVPGPVDFGLCSACQPEPECVGSHTGRLCKHPKGGGKGNSWQFGLNIQKTI